MLASAGLIGPCHPFSQLLIPLFPTLRFVVPAKMEGLGRVWHDANKDFVYGNGADRQTAGGCC